MWKWTSQITRKYGTIKMNKMNYDRTIYNGEMRQT